MSLNNRRTLTKDGGLVSSSEVDLLKVRNCLLHLHRVSWPSLNLHVTCWGGGSLPRLVRRLRMLRSDICRRADTGGILDSMLGSRVTSAFMSLRSSSSWFSTVTARQKKKETTLMSGFHSVLNERKRKGQKSEMFPIGQIRPAASGLGLFPNGPGSVGTFELGSQAGSACSCSGPAAL